MDHKTYQIHFLGFLFEEADISWLYALHTEDVVHGGQDQRRAHDRTNNGPGDQTGVRYVTNNSLSYNNTWTHARVSKTTQFINSPGAESVGMTIPLSSVT